MALKLGATTLTALYLGSTAIATAYLGSTEVYTTGGAFSPASLFASGEEGAWYEPSTTTAFKSTTDLTPCGYGDGAGFLLDKSKGAGYADGSFTGLGSELVTNGTFNTDASGWTATNGTVLVFGGEATLTRSGSTGVYSTLHRSITTEVGKTYYCSVEWRGGTSPKFSVQAGTTARGLDLGSSGISNPPPSIGEFVSVMFVATGTTTWITVVGDDTAGSVTTATFDNISVRELPGNHATQVTAGARPILARVPESGRRNLLEKTEEFDDAYWNTVLNATVTLSASELDPTGNSGTVYRLQASAGSTWWMAHSENIPNTTYTISFWVKSASGSNETFRLAMDSGVVLSGDLIATSSWQRFTLTGLANRTADGFQGLLRDSADNAADLLVWGAQLEAGSTATAYQRVVDEYDITEAGVTSLDYLSFDGADDDLEFTLDAANWNSGVLGFQIPAINTEYVLFGRLNSNSDFAFVGVSGSNLSYSARGSSVRLNGVDYLNTTRGQFYTATATGTSTVMTFEGINMASGATNWDFFGYNSAEKFSDKVFGAVILDRAFTGTERADTEAYLANRSGVTL